MTSNLFTLTVVQYLYKLPSIKTITGNISSTNDSLSVDLLLHYTANDVFTSNLRAIMRTKGQGLTSLPLEGVGTPAQSGRKMTQEPDLCLTRCECVLYNQLENREVLKSDTLPRMRETKYVHG